MKIGLHVRGCVFKADNKSVTIGSRCVSVGPRDASRGLKGVPGVSEGFSGVFGGLMSLNLLVTPLKRY